jgi:hypothetical protein
VPSPLEHLGEVIGTPNILHNTQEIYGYMRALAAASPRAQLRHIGTTEEGRDMIEVIVADEATIADLERYRGYLNRLSDPRTVSEEEAREIMGQAKPVYYLGGGLHSGETGAPEMLMELAYRLAVEESPFVSAIRDNVITVMVPVLEPDGRDRMVDTYNYAKAHGNVGPGLPYWGKYVAHDNNRDGYGLALALTRNVLGGFMYWKPTVMHDLHESANFLYVSTGTGPYNAELDALTIDHAADQARHARRLDACVLHRLGGQLPVLDRQHPQQPRPFLRDPGQQGRRYDGTHDPPLFDRDALVQAEPAAREGDLVDTK